ncbi:MAG: hypothetical protein JNN22_16140 [Rhodospirillales bacterium]|nr:hypothetical protein [Rhodospirillales bacterium]
MTNRRRNPLTFLGLVAMGAGAALLPGAACAHAMFAVYCGVPEEWRRDAVNAFARKTGARVAISPVCRQTWKPSLKSMTFWKTGDARSPRETGGPRQPYFSGAARFRRVSVMNARV